MSRPHFFAGAPEIGETVTLDPDDAHHALRSLRLDAGDRFTSSDGTGHVVVCRIVRATNLLVEGAVEERTSQARPVPRVTVLLAPPKGERLQWAVQKLTEVGVDRIVLVDAERSVRRWEGERAERVVRRMSSIANEAAKQSRRGFLPEVAGPVRWDAALDAALEEGTTVVLWERAKERLTTLLPQRTDRVALVVGPEGGIADDEAERAAERGASLASLGAPILRTETAAVVGATVVLTRYGRLG